MNSKILSGSAWLSFGSFVSRVLGVIYLIPWLAMIGSYSNQLNAQAVFNSSYTPYAILIAVGTAGLPSVIARYVSKMNSEGNYEESKYVFQLGFMIMLITGIICGGVLYALAPWIASNSPVSSVKQGTLSIRMLVPAIAILPSMSMLRGWFQGNNDLKPYGISQIIEQVARVIFIIISTFIIIYVFNINYIVAVYFSVLGAFIGSLFSYIYLLMYNKSSVRFLSIKRKYRKKKIIIDIYELWHQAIPFVLVGSIITLCQFVDQIFFKQILMDHMGYTSEYTNYLYTVASANPSKITTIIISIGLSISEATLPVLSGIPLSRVDKIRNTIKNNYSLIFFMLTPTVIILSFVSGPIYVVLFHPDKVGSYYLVQNIIQCIFLGLSINILTIFQSLHNSRKAVKMVVCGLIAKILLQFPCVYLFKANGIIYSTDIVFFVICVYGFYYLDNKYFIRIKDLFAIIWSNVILILSLILYSFTFNCLNVKMNKIEYILYICIYSLIFSLYYLYISNILGSTKIVFGKKVGYKYFKYKHFK